MTQPTQQMLLADTQQCSGCKKVKPFSDFQFRRDTNKFRPECRECLRPKVKRRTRAHRQKVRPIRTCGNEGCANLFTRPAVQSSGATIQWCSDECRLELSAARAAMRYQKYLANHPMYQRKYKYGLTEDQLNQHLAVLGHECPGCLNPLGWDNFHVDHDPACCPSGSKRLCGKCNRGLLCFNCNVSLGNARDNIATLHRLADYLAKYAQVGSPF